MNVAMLAWCKAVADGTVIVVEVRRDAKGRFVKKESGCPTLPLFVK